MPTSVQLPNGDTNFVTAGTGILQIGVAGAYGGTDIGYLGGDLDYLFFLKPILAKTGRPLQFITAIPIEIGATLDVTLMQLSIANFSHAAAEQTITTNNGNATTITAQSYTFGTFPLDPNFQAIFIGPGIAASPTITNVAGNVTYTTGTDYLQDSGNGYIIRNPAGNITSGQTVKFTGSNTPPSWRSVKLGLGAQFTPVSLLFTHYRPNGDYTELFIPSAMSDGQAHWTFRTENLNLPKIKWMAIPNNTYVGNAYGTGADSPFGWVRETTLYGT